MADRAARPRSWRKYYANRASEYEKIYEKARAAGGARVAARPHVPALFAGIARCWRVACGTGYWTQFIARSAKKVHACDINDAVLEIAREKPIEKGKVEFFKADAVTLENVPAGCDAAFAGFWWSHVKKSGIAQFVSNLAGKLESGALVGILDNQFVGAMELHAAYAHRRRRQHVPDAQARQRRRVRGAEELPHGR